jgi:integrase
MRAYENALGNAPKIEFGASQTKPGTVAAAVALYFASHAYRSLALETQRQRRRTLEKFREEHGWRDFGDLRKQDVMKLLSGKTPYVAKNFIKALRALIAATIEAGLREDDPTAGIRIRLPASPGFKDWPEDAIERFEDAYPIGTRERLAFDLLLWTAQRRGDVIRMGRQHIDKDGFLHIRQAKTGAEFPIPVAPQLRASIEACPHNNLTFLTT